MEFPTLSAEKGEIEIPSRKSIPIYLPALKDLGLSTLPFPPQLAEDPLPLSKGMSPCWVIIFAIFDYWPYLFCLMSFGYKSRHLWQQGLIG